MFTDARREGINRNGGTVSPLAAYKIAEVLKYSDKHKHSNQAGVSQRRPGVSPQFASHTFHCVVVVVREPALPKKLQRRRPPPPPPPALTPPRLPNKCYSSSLLTVKIWSSRYGCVVSPRIAELCQFERVARSNHHHHQLHAVQAVNTLKHSRPHAITQTARPVHTHQTRPTPSTDTHSHSNEGVVQEQRAAKNNLTDRETGWRFWRVGVIQQQRRKGTRLHRYRQGDSFVKK